MKSIRLYGSQATIQDLVKGNGLGYLEEVTEAVETEEMNGDNTLSLKVPYLSPTYKKLKTRDILLAPVDDQGSWYPFRIYEIAKPINGIVEIKANGLDKDTSDYPIRPFTVTASDEEVGITVQDYISAIYGASILPIDNGVYTAHTLPFYIDIDESYLDFDPLPYSTLEVSSAHTLRELLGDDEQYGILGLFKGEYEYKLDRAKNKIHIILHNRRGELTNIKFRYSKDLVGVEMEENVENQYNAVYPFWFKKQNGVGNFVESVHLYPPDLDDRPTGRQTNLVYCDVANSSEPGDMERTPIHYHKVLPFDMTKYFEEQPTPETLYDACCNYIVAYNVDKPELTLKVTPALLQNSQQYIKEFGQRQYNLGDTVGLSYPEMGIDVLSMRVVKKELDCLTCLYKSLEFENPIFYITDMVGEVASITEKIARMVEYQYMLSEAQKPTVIEPFYARDSGSAEHPSNLYYLGDQYKPLNSRFPYCYVYLVDKAIMDWVISANVEFYANDDQRLFIDDLADGRQNYAIYSKDVFILKDPNMQIRDIHGVYGVVFCTSIPPWTSPYSYDFKSLILTKG